ncbi:MAG: YceI family protein [Spongiibacteraceae bacterium]|nr:YceI family protein [Spongiibacteraceae bacterium]
MAQATLNRHKNKLSLFVSIILIPLFLNACSSLIAPNVKTEIIQLKKGQYRIDPAHSALLFKVDHLGLSTYVGRFNQIEATLNFDPDNLAATELNALIYTDSIDVNNTDLEKTLKKSNWFNTKKYPQATFKTVSVKVLSDNTFEFTGALTLLGVTKPVVLNGKFNGGATNMLSGRYTLGFSATAEVTRSEFGMDIYVGLVGDKIMLEIYSEFLRE